MLSFVKIHLTFTKLKRGEHVQNLTDIRIDPLHKLVNDVGWNLELFPAKQY